ncbi:hypothetical protein K491DRAFT_699166 [Lophiostoma macrostomum CBS 122681]|uniref:Uncharacterized protein n=1 Tax=Lophiostoma macrostomum CBS 122681 TaxID=1314788 RepID=A0A6A6SM89_9PLEO|nr:hypothetical protein K491DRAFT_699166 [Lophiostoma macrostomum CBS 122681]
MDHRANWSPISLSSPRCEAICAPTLLVCHAGGSVLAEYDFPMPMNLDLIQCPSNSTSTVPPAWSHFADAELSNADSQE